VEGERRSRRVLSLTTMEAPKATVQRARSLRRRLTPPEVRLWVALRGKAIGWRFRRQHPIGPYVLDFYCDAAKLAVEVDGSMHYVGENQVRDARRDAWMLEQGVRTLRLQATLIRDDLDAALRMIDHAAKGLD